MTGVIVKLDGVVERPVTAGDGRLTVHVTAAAAPEVRVATTLEVVFVPAVTVALEGLQATV
jgi:hypothetical protein